MGMTLAELPRMGDLILLGTAGLGSRTPSWRRGSLRFLENLVFGKPLRRRGESRVLCPARRAPWHRHEAAGGLSGGGSSEEQGGRYMNDSTE